MCADTVALESCTSAGAYPKQFNRWISTTAICYSALQVLWYLASDSLTARRAAKQRFGDKIITDTQAWPLY